MGVLNVLGGIGAIILAVELLLFLLVFLAVCVALWFGMRFLKGKSDYAFGKLNDLLKRGVDLENKGLRLVAKPIVVAAGASTMARVTVARLVARLPRPSPPAAGTTITVTARPFQTQETAAVPIADPRTVENLT